MTVPTLSGIDIKTYSNSLFRIWSLGQKEINNGVLLIVAPNEREVRIEVSYGLKKELTDAISAVIINNFIVPNFHEENYQKGIIKAVNAITEVITGSNADVMSRIKAKAEIIEVQSKRAEKEKMIANILSF